MKITIETKATAEQELFRLAEIITKLRYNTKLWEELYGSVCRNNKKYWEEKADAWIDQHVKIEE